MSYNIAHIKEDFYTGELVEQSVSTHLNETSLFAKKFLSKIGMPETGKLCGLTHDMGKFSAEFYNYLRSSLGMISEDDDDYVDAERAKGKIDHSTCGAQYIYKNANINKIFKKILCICNVSHHSGLIDCLSFPNPIVIDNFIRRIEKDDFKTHYSEVMREIDQKIMEEIKNIDYEKIEKEFIVFLEKNKNGNNPKIMHFYLGMLTKLIFSALIDADRRSTTEFMKEYIKTERIKGRKATWNSLIEEFEKNIGDLECESEINLIRKEISEKCLEFSQFEQGIYELTAPTGSGKLFASIRGALHHANKYDLDKIFYIGPFISVIEQNTEAIRNILGNNFNDVILEHHCNFLFNLGNWKNKVFFENWDKQIICTTFVQFLNTLFSGGTKNIRRLHQICNSVIIFDEIQSIPIKSVHMFVNAINFLKTYCNCTIIFCTATQPLLGEIDKEKGCIEYAENYKIIKNPEKWTELTRRIKVVDKTRQGGYSNIDLVKFTYKMMYENKSKNCLIVANTKRVAKDIYKILKLTSKNKKCEIYHLTANMCSSHRSDILNKINEKLDNGDPVICVTTQLIESGIDISFEMGIRSLAGIDSIGQVGGRVNRHGEKKQCFLYIVNLNEENTGRLRDINVAKEITGRILREIKKNGKDENIIGIETIRRYYQYYFHDRKGEMEYDFKEEFHDDNILNLLSDNPSITKSHISVTNKPLSNIINHCFKTAGDKFNVIDCLSKPVIVPYKDGVQIIEGLIKAKEDKDIFPLLSRSQRFSINIFPDAMERMIEEGKILETFKESGIMYLRKPFYDDQFGLNEEVEESLIV